MPRRPKPPDGWARYDDGSACNGYGNSGFRAFIEPRGRRLRWVLTLYGESIGTGIGETSDDAERAVDSIVANRLARRRMHMSVYANMLGRGF